jgi:probable phosphoglycerate mutase
LQIQRLAQYFGSCGIQFTRVFSSDLKRAQVTAEGICAEPTQQIQQQLGGPPLVPLLTPYLREQHFGSLEGAKLQSSAQAYAIDTEAAESEASMEARANAFLSEYLLPVLLNDTSNDEVVAVVAHGIILRVLWICITGLFNPRDIRFGPGVASSSWSNVAPSSFIPIWSNTGFVDLNIQRQLPPASQPLSGFYTTPPQQGLISSPLETAPPVQATVAPETLPSNALLSGWTMDVLAVDNKAHLADLRRTRGGIGSAAHDERQQKIDGFFGTSGVY